MYIHDYDLADQTVTIVDTTNEGEDIYCELSFTFDTYTDYYWHSYDGYHETEVPYLEFENIQVGSVKMYAEDGARVSWGIDSNEAEEIILDLLRDNREQIEEWMKDDY